MNLTECSLAVAISPQPTETTCGPTCLSATYAFWERPVPLPQLTSVVDQLDGGGTLAVQLACDALRRGFQATIVTYNLQLFDPTWFDHAGRLRDVELLQEKLQAQLEAKSSRGSTDVHRLRTATECYIQYLELGGVLCMKPLDASLITHTISAGIPILCGLSATYLYMESREYTRVEGDGETHHADDVAGEPQGHFVVLHGYRDHGQTIQIADPLHPNPIAPTGFYEAPLTRVASAILLGIVTYDANMLMIYPPQKHWSA